MKKRLISTILTFFMILVLMPMTSSAVPAEKVVLNVTIRDFKEDGVLFEGTVIGGAGLVQSTLGADHKPVFNLSDWQALYGLTVTQEQLNSFYHDIPGVNQRTGKMLTLNADADGFYIINSAVDGMGAAADGYFPIDGELFGNENYNHNFNFSTELHAVFQYKPGDYFMFEGDDDLWAFFNGKLCVDLGGVHGALSQEVLIDDLVNNDTLDIKPGDYVSFDMFHMERHRTQSNMYVKTNIDFENFENSDWATYELFTAFEYGLIPEKLSEEDLTLPVYRDEFAAVAVRLYEAMSGKTAAAGENPFNDTADSEVLKAYSLGIVKGTSETTFSPGAKLTRQEAAVMLMRAYKAAKIKGWTLDTDSLYSLDYKKPSPFADDTAIDAWAKDSVYFMVANNVIKGLGSNKFGPKNTTDAEAAAGYANSTREQALIISVRSFVNLK